MPLRDCRLGVGIRIVVRGAVAVAVAQQSSLLESPLQGIPTRWFRWKAQKTKSATEVQIKNALATDNYVVEVFGGAACDAPSSRACNDDAKPGTDHRPEATFDAVEGQTYFAALGIVEAPSGIVPALRFDD